MKLFKSAAQLVLLLPVLFVIAIVAWIVFLVAYKFVIANAIGSKIAAVVMALAVILAFRK